MTRTTPSEHHADRGAQIIPELSPRLLSICIPTYNRGNYLQETLESLLPQMTPDVELIVYDTGSTDDTQWLMSSIARKSKDLRYIWRPDKLGVDETLLLLLQESCGEYVWFFGSDDLLKPGALEIVRRRIAESPVSLALVYLNHEVVDNSGKLLIASNTGSQRNRTFRDGRRCAAWLGLHLGYISSCILRKEDCGLMRAAAQEFVGSLWLGLYLNLASLSRRRPALYIGQPLVSARRNPSNTYDYGKVFFENASRVFWAARKNGLGRFTIYGAMNKTVRTIYLPLNLGWHCDDPQEFRRTFPVMLRTCWAYPWFWLLIAPMRVAPFRLVRGLRNSLRGWRKSSNNTVCSNVAQQKIHTVSPSGDRPTPFQMSFRALLRTRRLSAACGADRFLKAVPSLISGYRVLYACLAPRKTIRTEFRGHTLYLDPRDLEITKTILTLGAYERQETDVFLHMLEEGMVVVDAGANVGHYTLEAARCVGMSGRVFAFEPEPRNFDLLCRNIEANGYRNVTPVQKALSDRCGTARLAISPDNFGAHRLEASAPAGKCIDVETITLDEYFSGRPQRLDIVKMDTQGAEMSILEGMGWLLSANPDISLLTEFWPEGIRANGHNPENFLQALAAAGFHLGILDQETARISTLAADCWTQFIQKLLNENRGKYFADLVCLRGKSAQGIFGPHEWTHSSALDTQVYAAQG